MSTVIVDPGDTLSMSVHDKKVVVFDFDALNLPDGVSLMTAPFTITPLVQNGSTALTKDNEALISNNRKAQVRLIATTATLGDRYRVSVIGSTTETPSQDKEYSIDVLIEKH